VLKNAVRHRVATQLGGRDTPPSIRIHLEREQREPTANAGLKFEDHTGIDEIPHRATEVSAGAVAVFAGRQTRAAGEGRHR